MSPVLFPQLVPSTCWYSNLRSLLPRREWDRIRRQVYKLADYRCQICGGRGKQHPVEAHEMWMYDDEAGVQRLDRIMALCPMCHAVQHLGRANAHGQLRSAVAHMAKVNGWSSQDAILMAEVAFEQWAQRSQRQWDLDLRALDGWGFDQQIIEQLRQTAMVQRSYGQNNVVHTPGGTI